jgi:hypothetical protein
MNKLFIVALGLLLLQACTKQPNFQLEPLKMPVTDEATLACFLVARHDKPLQLKQSFDFSLSHRISRLNFKFYNVIPFISKITFNGKGLTITEASPQISLSKADYIIGQNHFEITFKAEGFKRGRKRPTCHFSRTKTGN